MRFCNPKQIFRCANYLKGVYFYLGFPLPAFIIQGRKVFKGEYHSRKYGTFVTTYNLSHLPHKGWKVGFFFEIMKANSI